MFRVARATITSTDTNYLHEIRVGKHHLKADEPEKLGGKDEGPAPFDLYVSSLAACTAITLRMYAQRKEWDLGNVTIGLDAKMDEHGKMHVPRKIHADGNLTDQQWERLLEVAAKTPVTKVMSHGAEITSSREVN